MAGYEFIRAQIVEGGDDGAGAQGPKGSFNHKGGKELVINYDTGDTTDPIEEHHIVPYLIGDGKDKDDNTVQVLMAWKYKTDSTTHPGLGFRCYKVAKITLLGTSPDTRPPLGNGANDRKKLKINKQSCVDDW